MNLSVTSSYNICRVRSLCSLHTWMTSSPYLTMVRPGLWGVIEDAPTPFDLGYGRDCTCHLLVVGILIIGIFQSSWWARLNSYSQCWTLSVERWCRHIDALTMRVNYGQHSQWCVCMLHQCIKRTSYVSNFSVNPRARWKSMLPL